MFDNKYLKLWELLFVCFSRVTKEDPFNSLHKCLQFPGLLISIDR